MYACNGLLFNHESARRGETFVTRKITRGLCNIAQGIEPCLYLGNMNALRDWGHAKDYVAMQWLMLQQTKAADYVIATGQQHSIRQFVLWTAQALGITLEFIGSGLDEVGVVRQVAGADTPAIKPGDVIVRVDPNYFRPADVESLWGDASKARRELGWEPTISAQAMCQEMVSQDLQLARATALLRANGYQSLLSHE
jgi:GDPmannose 4,6-dehydratase